MDKMVEVMVRGTCMKCRGTGTVFDDQAARYLQVTYGQLTDAYEHDHAKQFFSQQGIEKEVPFVKEKCPVCKGEKVHEHYLDIRQFKQMLLAAN